MKIYTQNYNLNERTDKQFYCPPNSNFKIGIKAEENGQEVALSNINLYDGTSDGYVNQTYHIDTTVPEGCAGRVYLIKNCTGRTVSGEEMDYMLNNDMHFYNHLSTATASGEAIHYLSVQPNGELTIYKNFKWLKRTGYDYAAWWYARSPTINFPLSTSYGDLPDGHYLKFWNTSALTATHNVSGDVVFKKLGYKSSGGEYKGYKTFDISSDYDSKTYDVQIGGNQLNILSDFIEKKVGQNNKVLICDFTDSKANMKLTQNVQKTSVFEI